ncbi:MAG TPA: biopolymer transporter ExbD [Chitinophagaceae bacterium]|jgi:biopolymer transport protein ExbD|nr:biopolymer transporter ExbD [Chitinophagaceae bacterium]
MAEIDTSGGGKKGPGVKKGKKLSTRIDLTPMVDLGFLLITFFIFTTTMSKPKTMEIMMPSDKKIEEKDKTKAKDYCTMTVLLSKEHRVYYYIGLADDPLNPPKVEVTYFQNKNGIRDALIAHKKKVYEERMNGAPGHKPDDEPVILIKPDVNSQYEDMVNILDEMQINGISTYAMIDITDVDKGFISATEAANTGN